jgi:hypothetical protein
MKAMSRLSAPDIRHSLPMSLPKSMPTLPKGMAKAARRRARRTADDLQTWARSMQPKRMGRSTPAFLGSAPKKLAQHKTALIIAGGALIGLTAAGLIARSVVRARRAKGNGLDKDSPLRPADQLGRDNAQQGESGGLAEFAQARKGAASYPSGV